MNNLQEERLKIAVFIDVDNISIGVKQSMNKNFDVGAVLEAIKEKGEIITKIAYGDWKRADDFSRAMTQHAIQMVQRNATPGGDKNGADIALALDALETAFTRPHINAFVIVGGDSDFIALVEKLKQYDKTVFVVGGRGFTSIILQKNCHEFISYENLVGVHTSRKLTGRIQLSSSSTLGSAMPLIRRALKILSDREVSPQLGLLKSTLLQLDSTFSERDYGVGSFRDFVQKLADAGYIYLKQVDRSILVEMKEGFKEREAAEDITELEKEPLETPQVDSREPVAPEASVSEPAPEISEPGKQNASSQMENAADIPPTLQAADATAALEELFRNLESKPHWPLYLRTFKQLLRAQQPPFDERQYGISSTYDLARQAQRDNLFHIERNRQGILRIFPGERFPKIARETDETAEPAVHEISANEPVYTPDVPVTEFEEQQQEVAALEPVSDSVEPLADAPANNPKHRPTPAKGAKGKKQARQPKGMSDRMFVAPVETSVMEAMPETTNEPEMPTVEQVKTTEKAAKDKAAVKKPKAKPQAQARQKPAVETKASEPTPGKQSAPPNRKRPPSRGKEK